ncbi:MAG: beta-N-acetylglucosaminidase [Bacteroidetes bacterium GWC2_33_15]|nr:MAG: beta-N-acetylglucosaminidase [Bacteroidetes bacterium GWA2_33_15]OFX48936.1 MAG: beta-N-acetylglucosaminidase [Bacteroidetes bacterium GWC2_33_15]OFX64800.1 MAG: beta-N-acetylglucosaminidase [Bacteroidetes bacterium GWB2_32_14]OFX68502.1 MAG: beta-N-acetylglucosaminidase [Bacteroidetes bacterium GWD2_33_33]HAN19230.1 beta-N-acetylglucosaminidase [Bacteroidales bacterium]
MQKLIFFSLFIFLLSCKKETQNQEIFIIPKPVKIEYAQGDFTINKNTTIIYDKNIENLDKVAKYLHAEILKNLNLDLKINISEKKQKRNSILLIPDTTRSLGNESYNLRVTKKNIKITSFAANGSFYGVQTLLQLLNTNEINGKINYENLVPCVKIFDKPRFQWRGMHLDVCRHFYDVDFVKKYIDLLALHKMNTFHWHLTEDQGWRIEIKKYPRLTETGAFRPETMVGKNWDEFDSTPHFGFYTQEEIKEIVQYAADRFITIVPEIEMPGHSLAALTAYPEFGCTGGPYEVAKTWGVFDDVYCAGNDSTFKFLEDILSEIIELFPGKYIHIGGDECPKTRWEKCPKCQKRMKNEGLKNEFELQSYFIQRIEKYLVANNKKLIGWDEILEGGLAPEATVMSWRGKEGGIQSARMGHDVVMSPNSHCYFDHYQADPKNEPLAIGGFTDLSKVYNYEPVPDELDEQESKHILGAQANIWTEYISTPEHLEYMVLPRMCALSEVVWSDKQKDFNDFKTRLKRHVLRLKAKEYNYRNMDF